MIAPSSLSAVSVAGAGPIRPADALRPFGRTTQVPAPTPPPRNGPDPAMTSPTPTRTLPRGSLLDLTV